MSAVTAKGPIDIIQRAWKTELKPTAVQIEHCARACGVARFVYNWGLEQRKRAYEERGETLSAFTLGKMLNAIKLVEYPWLLEVSKCVPEYALRNLDLAFKHFFRRIKQGGEKPGFPRFKSRHRGMGGFTLNGSIHIESRRIRLPRVGWIGLKESGYLPQGVRVISATVSEQAGRWFVSVQAAVEQTITPATGEPVGVDVGVAVLATVSDGRTFANPKALRASGRRLKRAQRVLSRRQKGSKRRDRAKARVAKLHYRVGCIREDAIHKATSALVARAKPDAERPSAIGIEDLNVTGMLKNHCLAAAISDASFGEFRRQLEYKAVWGGSDVVVADRFYPSSKRCSACGAVRETLDLSERMFLCTACGLVMDRDLNAAVNLWMLAGGSPESLNGRGGHVRLAEGIVPEGSGVR